ncbi:MAG: hypothetical protein GX802_00870 [Clostridiales bacterium]|nr:hypothetical protein [Clostridiales bacterium]
MNTIHFQNLWKEALSGTILGYCKDSNGIKHYVKSTFKSAFTLLPTTLSWLMLL